MPLERSIEISNNPNIGEKFSRIQNIVDDLVEEKTDSKFVARAILDIKTYMQTLIGEKKLSIKDRLGIGVDILIQRLFEVELVIKAIEISKFSRDDIHLFYAYLHVLNFLKTGFIPISNLEDIFIGTLDSLEKGFIHLTSSKHPSELKFLKNIIDWMEIDDQVDKKVKGLYSKIYNKGYAKSCEMVRLFVPQPQFYTSVPGLSPASLINKYGIRTYSADHKIQDHNDTTNLLKRR